MQLNTPEFNQSLKRSVEEILHSNPEILQPIVAEIIEDYILGKAIEECENDDVADFDEVMAFLDAHRTKK